VSSDPSWRVHTREPRGVAEPITRLRDRDELEPYLDDAAHYTGGHCREVCLPRNEAEVASVLASGEPVLPVGAQSSLTGGATPRGGVVVSLARMNAIEAWASTSVRLGPGVVLAELEQALRERDFYYPPQPTFDGATVGGIVATNAAGAATFKHGTTRAWVRALTVVLANGEVLELERGQVTAGAEGVFEIVSTSGEVTTVAVPTYTLPAVPKCSAGYHAEPEMDLVDLFIGAEGTLGVIVQVELRLLERRPALFAGLVPTRDDVAALALVSALREASQRTWAASDSKGVDVAAVEYMDARCLALLREDGADGELAGALAGAGAALLFQGELDPDMSRERAFHELGRVTDATLDTPLVRLGRLLDDHGMLDVTVPALPGETARRDGLFRLREAVPEAVNRRIKDAQRTVDASITKSASDVIVPVEHLAQSLDRYREVLARHGLDHAIWGHISDGNVHPNVLPHSAAEAASARRAQLEIGDVAIGLGGCPMSEHGVGRNPIKQQLLVRLYGSDGVADMRRVKRALDPCGVLAPGVIFTEESSP